MIAPNFDAMDAHLKAILCSPGWVLTSLREVADGKDKDGKPKFKMLPSTRTFGDGQLDALHKWVAAEQAKGANVYVHYNPIEGNPKKKPPKSAVMALAYVYVDIDPAPPPEGCADVAAHYAAERARILAQCEAMPDGIPKPTICVFSGGGYQLAWKLSEPKLSDRTAAAIADLECYSRHLEEVFDADNCHDLGRMLRLAGTWNFPDARKRAKGRTEPVMAELCWADGPNADLSQFKKAAPKGSAVVSSNGAAPARRTVELSGNVERFESVDDIKELLDESDARNALCRVMIVQGRDPDKPPPKSRSEPLFFVCCQMVRAGCSDDAIYAVITDPEFPISESVLDKGSGMEAYAVQQIENAREKVEVEAEEFQKDKDGKLYTNLHNARLALRKLGVRLEFDEFADRSQVLGLPEFGPQLDDAAVTRLWLAVEERFRLVYPKERFVAIVSDAARQNRRHPVREFLDGLKWDETPRLDGWLSSYLGAEDTEYTRAVGTLVLVAAVRRVREPGCKFDEMLVLEGLQGGEKSTALKVLAVIEDWFSDDLPLNAKAQQFIEQTTGKWIVEAGELKGMRKGDVDALKSCLSRQRDRARMAWGRLPHERARQFVIIGTTNSNDYLKDNTGNRRFWPVRMGEIRLADMRRDREQLWAEAAAREAAGASIRLDRALYGVAREEQEKRRVEDPWVQVLAEHLGDLKGKFRATDAWEIVGVPKDRRTQQDNVRLGEVMRELGWARKQLRFGGNPEGCYVRGAGIEGHHPAINLVWEPESPGSPVRVLRIRLDGDPVPEQPDDGEVLG
jgi:hypothetical protein